MHSHRVIKLFAWTFRVGVRGQSSSAADLRRRRQEIRLGKRPVDCAVGEYTWLLALLGLDWVVSVFCLFILFN
jgi:hypothetical protein